MASEEEKKKMKEKIAAPETLNPLLDKMFEECDINKNGKIEKDELALALKKIHEDYGLKPPTREDIENEFKKLDINEDKEISKEEFKKFVLDVAYFAIDNM